MRPDHDIHVHTNLSACSHDPLAVPSNYIERATALGLRTIGFANHLWDSGVPGASGWYQPQDVRHVLQIREMIPADSGVKVLIGCETEYCGDGKIGITRESSALFDYVLVPISHFHMKGFVIPASVTSVAEVADLMVRRFLEVVDLGLATGIAHPFLPLGFMDRTDDIIAAISDNAFIDCFGRAAEAGVSIEIHQGFFPAAAGKERPGLHDETFLRVLSIAKSCGCSFHFASDTHTLAGLDAVLALGKYADELGIGAGDMAPFLSR